MQTVTVSYAFDPASLGPAATPGDLSIFIRNVTKAVEDRFGVRVIPIRNAAGTSLESNDPDINEWLTALLAGDGWLAFLPSDEEPPTVRRPRV